MGRTRLVTRMVRPGGAEQAPRVVPMSGPVPSWSGKAAKVLTTAGLQAIGRFRAAAALELGMDDFLEARPPRRNPFHPQFLHGEPCAAFAPHYRRGCSCAEGAGALVWSVAGGRFCGVAGCTLIHPAPFRSSSGRSLRCVLPQLTITAERQYAVVFPVGASYPTGCVAPHVP